MALEFLDVGQPDDVLPAGIHELSTEEVKELLVDPFEDSGTRLDIFTLWMAFRARLENLLPIEQEFIDGSFVTSRTDPADIDASYWFDADEYAGLPPLRRSAVDQLFQRAKPQFKVHAFPVPRCPDAHPAWPHFEHTRKWTRRYWKAYSDPSKVVVPALDKP